MGMQHSPGNITRYAIIALGQGTLPVLPPGTNLAWPVYCPTEPDRPDNCITVRTTAGRGSGRTSPDGESIGHYGVQIRVRSAEEDAGYLKTENIRLALETVHLNLTVTIGAVSYKLWCFANIGDVLPLGKAPESKRFLHTVNALLSVRDI